MDLDSRDAPVLAVGEAARSANRLLVSRPAGLHAARLGEEGRTKKRKKIGRAVTGPQFGRRGGGERGGGRRGRGLKNDIVGVAVRPRPVGERREGLLEKVCGKRRCCVCY